MNNFRRRVSSAEERGFGDPITGRGYIGDYEAVDLGLPSGLLWATWNVGATGEPSYGKYYQWGAGAATYTQIDQFHTGGTDSSYTLPSSADTATQVMGEGWRMPTQAEFQDLIDNTNHNWVTNFNGSGINGGKFTSKTNPNAYVFFPASGIQYKNISESPSILSCVWSSTPNGGFAYYLSLNINTMVLTSTYRNRGLSVRGVHVAV